MVRWYSSKRFRTIKIQVCSNLKVLEYTVPVGRHIPYSLGPEFRRLLYFIMSIDLFGPSVDPQGWVLGGLEDGGVLPAKVCAYSRELFTSVPVGT